VAWRAVRLVGSYELSLGVSSLLHDVAPKRFTESFRNTSATCCARCGRCSEACTPRTCNMCNTLDSRRRRTYPTATWTFRRIGHYARFAPRENELLVWLTRASRAVERGPSAEDLRNRAACRSATRSLPVSAVDGDRSGGRHAPDPTRRPAGHAARLPTIPTSEQCDDERPKASAVNDAAVAAYGLSVQAGNPLSERRGVPISNYSPSTSHPSKPG
jgi:hypothetical protein